MTLHRNPRPFLTPPTIRKENMRIFKFLTTFKQVWSLIKLIRELNAIRASFPGVVDEKKLRLWLLANVKKIIAFSKTTSNVIDDAVAAYVWAFLDNNETWNVTYNMLRKVCGLRANEAVYGSPLDMMAMLGKQKFDDLEDQVNQVLRETPLRLTHEQLSTLATGAIIAVVAQCTNK